MAFHVRLLLNIAATIMSIIASFYKTSDAMFACLMHTFDLVLAFGWIFSVF